jgi:flagellin-like hook-associated protein FlgL
MKSMEVFLNEDINGQFLFAGTSTQTQPVDLSATTQNALQTKYDGYSRMYPWTREAHVDKDLTTDSATTGNITTVWNNGGDNDDPTNDTGTITAGAGTLSAIPVGALLTINGGVNDGKTVTVVSNDGTTINFAGNVTPAGGTADFWVGVPSDVVDSGGAEAGVTLTVNSYYSGDREEVNQRLSKDAAIDYDINATHAAFEKAIRAMGIIAQGGWGDTDAATGLSDNPGNLCHHTERAEEAYWLLTSALSINNTGTPPYGSVDQQGTNKLNLEQMAIDLGFYEVKISHTVTKHERMIAFYDQKVAEIENVDTLEIMTSLLDNQRALEASYQVMARVKQLSLSNYL